MEYITRKRLSALGFSEPLSNLDCITAELLMTIDMEFATLMADEMKKKPKGR